MTLSFAARLSRYREEPMDPISSSFLKWDERSDDFWKKDMSNNDFDITLSSKSTSSYDDRYKHFLLPAAVGVEERENVEE